MKETMEQLALATYRLAEGQAAIRRNECPARHLQAAAAILAKEHARLKAIEEAKPKPKPDWRRLALPSGGRIS